MKEILKQKQGITLIALVITIIVLLILAGVSIAMLTGNNGILTQATNAKEQTQISSEKEAIQLTMINKEVSNDSKYDIGRKLYPKTLENSNIWDVIVINDTQEKYDEGWRYIPKETDVESYGKTKYNWLVNEDTGEFVQLEEGKYTELSYGDELAVTDGLVFNVDSNNMDNSDLTTWGEGVSLYGFDDNTEEITNEGLNFDGKNDYVEFKSTADYSKGFTLSFYGSRYTDSYTCLFVKQRENDVLYSCRFGLKKDNFTFNTSKNRSDSKWENNANLNIQCNRKLGNIEYYDLIFDANTNEFKLYQNNKFVDSDIVNEQYWHGENGGKQIMEDNNIFCYLGRVYRDDETGSGNFSWSYSKLTIYSLRLYNRPLNESELKSNYDKTIAAHTIEQ